MNSKPYFVYILRCKNGALYTGIALDLARRLQEHNNGKGGAYTRSQKPVKYVYNEKYPDKGSALKREAQIKSWPKSKKMLLVTSKS